MARAHPAAAAGTAIPLGFCDAVIAAIGTRSFAPTLRALADHQVGVDELFAYALGEGAPVALASAGQRAAGERATSYAERFHRLDPLRRHLPSLGREPSAHRIAAAEIADPAYRARCFEGPGFAEKWCFAAVRGARTFVLSFYRQAARGPGAIADLASLAAIALPALERHAALITPEPDPRARIERKLSAHYPALTERERAVCARTLIGMTAEAIALDLAISPATALTYRRRAYERYRFSNANQFLARLL